jgi:hypothetical protein
MKMLVFLFVLVSCAHHGAAPHKDGASILQLATTETASEFNVLLPRASSPEFIVVRPNGETVVPTAQQVVERASSDWVMHQVQFTGLAGANEDLQFIVKSQGRVIDQRSFRLFSNQGERLRFVVGSCADIRQSQHQAKLWASVAAQNPEWVFLIGDNVYAAQDEKEISDPAQLWQRYVDHRRALDIYRWKKLIPVHSIWDDNDFGQKDGGKSYALLEEAQRIFRTFFLPAFPVDNVIPGPGVASRLQLRGMHFAFLDDRSFRDAPGDGEHFGLEQESWMLGALKSAQLPTWLISGDQFFGGYHAYESYEGNHPRSFENFLRQLREVATPFVFVSGDRHMTELMQFPRALLGQLSFEITTSPLHGKVYPGTADAAANPWRVVVHDSSLNFMSVETWLEDTSWNIQLTSRNEAGVPLFGRELSLTTEALKDFTIEKRQRRRKYRRARWRRR